VLYLLTEDKDASYLFLCNTGHEFTMPDKWAVGDTHVSERAVEYPSLTVRLGTAAAGDPVELDPLDGAVYAAGATRDGDIWRVATSLPKLGSRLYVFPKKKTAASQPPRPKVETVRTEAVAESRWQFCLSEPNVCVLDRPSYRVGRGPLQGPEEILRVDNKVREALKLSHRGGAMVQPWARRKTAADRGVDLTLEYAFDARETPRRQMLLAIEQPRRFAVTLNGHAIDTEVGAGYWTDRSLRTLRVDPAIVRRGENRLTLTCRYTEGHPGLEIVYLLGDFGVEVTGTAVSLTAPPETLAAGDWTAQGLPFYGGSVTYLAEINPRIDKGEKAVVALNGYDGVAARILVDGKEAGVVGWEPHEVDITRLLCGRPVTLGVEILGHRRNSHGPLHLTDKRPGWTGPGEFKTSGDKWTDDYSLVPCGLRAAPTVKIVR